MSKSRLDPIYKNGGFMFRNKKLVILAIFSIFLFLIQNSFAMSKEQNATRWLATIYADGITLTAKGKGLYNIQIINPRNDIVVLVENEKGVLDKVATSSYNQLLNYWYSAKNEELKAGVDSNNPNAAVVGIIFHSAKIGYKLMNLKIDKSATGYTLTGSPIRGPSILPTKKGAKLVLTRVTIIVSGRDIKNARKLAGDASSGTTTVQ
jgi:hypothetical protein